MKIRHKLTANKKDILAITIIFIISVLFFKNFLGPETVMSNGHYLHEQTFFSYNYKTALEDKTLPFWTPYWYSGQPIYGDSQAFFINLTLIFIILFKNIFLAISLSTLFYFFISGLSMYLLVKYLLESREAAFISAIIYMFNGLIFGFIVSGNPSILEPYSLIPLIFLFIIKAKKSKNPLNYSIFAGILMVFQIFSGGVLILVYTLLLIGAYLALDLISAKFKTNIIKTITIGFVLIIILFGLSAVKLLPNYDYVKKTNRAQGLSYQEYIGADHFIFKDFFKVFVIKKSTSSLRAHLGIISFLLVLLSLGLWRRKMVIYLTIISIFALFLASGGFLAELFYKFVPTFSQTRHIGRVMFIFIFSSSVLAGYGFSYLSTILSKKIKVWNKIKNFFVILISLLIMAELIFVIGSGIPLGLNIKNQLEENHLAKYLQQENEKFRITTFDVDDLISFFASSYYAHYDLETLSGGGGLWINDFIGYLGVAKNYNNSKLLGILNLKYATSTKQIDVPGFKEIKKFEECISCNDSEWTYWIAGPYLYENEDYLPRYYFVENAVLVVGDYQQSQEIIYTILLNKNFDPKTTVLIQGKNSKVNDYDLNFLKRFNTIILVKASIDGNSLPILEQYKNAGGRILPDILDNKNSIDFVELEDMFKDFEGQLLEVDSKSISANEIQVMPKNNGFLVLSEKFSLFDGWSAKKDNKKIAILRANNIISAIYVDSPGTITFKFMPKSFKKGLIISLLTLLIISAYFIYSFRNKKKQSINALQQPFLDIFSFYLHCK